MKQVDTLRLSLTGRCDLHCRYCRPRRAAAGGGGSAAEGTTGRPSPLSVAETVTVVRLLREHFGLQKVRLTGGEPLGSPRAVEVVEALSGLGVEVAMTTNGQRLAGLAARLRGAGLGRVNVSLDSLNPERFRRLTGGGSLARTLLGLEEARRVGLRPVKTNTVVLRGTNEDELTAIAGYGLERGFEPRFLELMAVGAARRLHRRWFVSAEDILSRLSSHFSLEPLEYDGRSPARMFAVSSGGRVLGRLGIIAPETMPFCRGCGRLRLTAEGELVGCLMQERGVDLRPWLRGGRGGAGRPSPAEDPHPERLPLFKSLVEKALGQKPGIRRRRRSALLAEIGG